MANFTTIPRLNDLVFLDTSFAIALASPGDESHLNARDLAGQMKRDGTRMLTTRAVLLEIGNALSKQRFRPSAIRLLQSLENDPRVEITPLGEELYARALDLFCRRGDKEWGLVDCVSYVVMQERAISQVLTADAHFRQMGFETLLP